MERHKRLISSHETASMSLLSAFAPQWVRQRGGLGPGQMNQCLQRLSHQLWRWALSRQRVKPAFEWQLLQSKATRWQMASKPALPQQHGAGSGFLKCLRPSNWASFLLLLRNNEWVYQGWNAIVAGQEQLAFETERVRECVSMCGRSSDTHERARPCAHAQMAEEFNQGFDMQIECWLVISAGCNTVLSFLQHNIRADNIHLRGAVDW